MQPRTTRAGLGELWLCWQAGCYPLRECLWQDACKQAMRLENQTGRAASLPIAGGLGEVLRARRFSSSGLSTSAASRLCCCASGTAWHKRQEAQRAVATRLLAVRPLLRQERRHSTVMWTHQLLAMARWKRNLKRATGPVLRFSQQTLRS